MTDIYSVVYGIYKHLQMEHEHNTTQNNGLNILTSSLNMQKRNLT
jgi:hypothetical protein